MPFELIVLGSGGHAKVTIAAARAAGRDVLGLYDDDESRIGMKVLGVPVLGTSHDIRANASEVVVGIGDNRAREQLATALNLDWATIVHPRAWVHPSASLGPGTVVFAGAIVQPDSSIGTHCILNTAASVDHDCTVESFVHIAPGAHLSGNVYVGRGTLIGVGASAIQGIRVGAWSAVGAGAAVIRDLPDGVRATGVPARVTGQWNR